MRRVSERCTPNDSRVSLMLNNKTVIFFQVRVQQSRRASNTLNLPFNSLMGAPTAPASRHLKVHGPIIGQRVVLAPTHVWSPSPPPLHPPLSSPIGRISCEEPVGGSCGPAVLWVGTPVWAAEACHHHSVSQPRRARRLLLPQEGRSLRWKLPSLIPPSVASG